MYLLAFLFSRRRPRKCFLFQKLFCLLFTEWIEKSSLIWKYSKCVAPCLQYFCYCLPIFCSLFFTRNYLIFLLDCHVSSIRGVITSNFYFLSKNRFSIKTCLWNSKNIFKSKLLCTYQKFVPTVDQEQCFTSKFKQILSKLL